MILDASWPAGAGQRARRSSDCWAPWRSRGARARASAITAGTAASLPGAMMWTPATPGMVGELLDQLDADALALGRRIGGRFEPRDDVRRR